MSANTPQYLQMRGDFAVRLVGTTGPFKPLFNAASAELSLSVSTEELKSMGDTPGTLAEVEQDRKATFALSLNSRHTENLKMFLLAEGRAVASATAIAYTLPDGVEGDIVDLGVSNVTEVDFGTLVDGVDFVLSPAAGRVEYLKTITETVGTVSHTGFDEIGIFNASSLAFEFLFTSETTGMTYILYNVKLNPSGSFSLVADGFAPTQLQGTLIASKSAAVDPVLGKYGKVRNAGKV